MFNQNSIKWTEDLIARMRALVVDKGLSAERAGLELHISRNAIIGKCFRLGIKMGDGPGKNSAAYRRRPELREISRATLHSNLKRSGPVKTAAPREPRTPRPRKPSIVHPVISYGWTAATTESRPAALWNLAHNGCHWPLYAVASDEPRENLFCGALATGPYCAAHRRAAVRT
jgi:hypothetical protein